MLESLKRWASGWVAFFMMSLLILSFAIWGIADYITGVDRSALATVGSDEISADQFQQAFQNELNAISQQAGQRISYEQARAVGLDQRVLSQLVGSAAVAEHARSLNLALSQEAIVEGLMRDPAFEGPDGKFSRTALNAALRELGLSEAQLLQRRRRDELQQHLTTALLRSTVVPSPMIDLLHQRREEKRAIEHFTIVAEKAIIIPEPTEEQLKETYDQNKSRFMTAPTRHLSVLMLSVDGIKKQADITDEQLKESYEQTKASYDKPEKRQVQQISFKDKAAAEAAKAEIAGGKDFLEVAKANGADASDVDLGLLERGQLIDSKIAEAAFSLEKDQVSDVIEGTFATVLLRVTEIQPGEQSTFEGSKDQVRNHLAETWARNQLQTLYYKVDDGRAAGKPLKEIASEMQLPFYDIESVTRDNTTPDGKRALDVADASAIITEGFRGEVGIESDPVRLQDGGYAWVDVLDQTPSTQRPFEEVQDDVKKLWSDTQRRQKLSALAKTLTDRVKGGEDMAKVAEEVGGSVVMAPPTTRARLPDGLTQAAMGQAFVLPQGGVGNAETSDGKSRTVFRVAEITAAGPATEAQRKALQTELQQQLRADQIAEYVGALRNRYGVKINESAFRRITGADTDDPSGRAF
ncbi:peptidyl-prolyl cis-trans isomerase D [Filomicrobium insigne]|uniref:Parvulin-like PPIase n=1 Tax=Filomicrobium insigne TaxID=418854 RepID=A0A1H0R972_9HYPH|nr:SurA N-terminal domain-containing protein [Filomicrobium insigne]SDP25596.1 peptidyl-prolyl cis-trans isomerase D [Filomicrobium insigne]